LFDLMKDNENITIAGFLAAVEAAKWAYHAGNIDWMVYWHFNITKIKLN
jgi:hypothetical protein